MLGTLTAMPVVGEVERFGNIEEQSGVLYPVIHLITRIEIPNADKNP